jgi:hypothetical protein
MKRQPQQPAFAAAADLNCEIEKWGGKQVAVFDDTNSAGLFDNEESRVGRWSG